MYRVGTFDRSVILTPSRQEVIHIEQTLLQAGLHVRSLHSQLILEERRAVVAAFCADDHAILVATDVACRGHNTLGDVNTIVNYNLPDRDVVLHRLGLVKSRRRQNNPFSDPVPQPEFDGISLVSPAEMGTLQAICDYVTCMEHVEVDFSVGQKRPFFIDGGANDPTRKELRAAAWGVVQIDDLAEPTYTRTGIVSADWGFDGTAFDGELYAVIQAAEHSRGLFVLYTGNQAVWQGCQHEHLHISQDTSRHKHLWSRLAWNTDLGLS
eukprot:4708690-Amphidinium_carterae.1